MTEPQAPPVPPEDEPKPMLDPDGDGEPNLPDRDPVRHLPVTPYDGGTSSGWSGTDTSRARAVHDDAEGVTARRQHDTIGYLERAGARGLTFRELGDLSGMHHGQSSGSLSNLHSDGHIARLTESRNRCKVYVLPEYINGRETERHGRNRKALPDGAKAAYSAVRDTLTTAQENRRPVLILNTAEVAVLLRLVEDAYGAPE